MLSGSLPRVIFASETGTSEEVAEDVAERLSLVLARDVECISIDKYDARRLPREDHVVIFIVSTWGQGDVPRPMQSFWKFLLQRRLPVKTSLPNMRYAVLGIGERSYPHFCHAALKLDARLEELGAQKIMRVGCVDSVELGREVRTWIRDVVMMWGGNNAMRVPLCPGRLRYANAHWGEGEGRMMSEQETVVERRVLMRQGKEGGVLVGIEGEAMEGSVAWVWPNADSEAQQWKDAGNDDTTKSRVMSVAEGSVESVMQRAGVMDCKRQVICEGQWWSGMRLDRVLAVAMEARGRCSRDAVRIAAMCSRTRKKVKMALKERQGIPFESMEQVRQALEWAEGDDDGQDDDEDSVLSERCCSLGMWPWGDEAQRYAREELRSPLECLMDLRSDLSLLPLPLILQCFRPSHPRPYSVAIPSSFPPSRWPNPPPPSNVPCFGLLISLASSSAPSGRLRRGACSLMLQCPLVSTIILSSPATPGLIPTSSSPRPPLLAICAGTGFAALSSVLQHGDTLLYGGRHDGPRHSLIPNGVNVRVALSSQGIRVWKLVLEDSKQIYHNFLSSESTGWIAVAGSVSNGMARDVQGALCTVIKENHIPTPSHEEAMTMLRQMEQKGKLIFDCWG